MKTIFKASLIATTIASIPSCVYALGAGPINVLTGLGQPLRAEVPLNATPQELQTLTARIASPEAFQQANIQYSSALSLLRVSVDTGGSHPVLRIRSERALNEPFLDLLLELNWANGRLVREYTFLLDPPNVAPPPPVVPRTRAEPPPSAAVSDAALQTAPAAVASGTAPEGHYVQRGDVLYRIAGAHRPDGTSLDQVLIALHRANPGSFDNGNINRLRAGSILRIPTVEEVRAVSAREARREVLAHVADFDAYRQRLAASAAPVASSPEPATQASAGKITPRVEEPQPVAPGTDLVQISHASDTSAPGSDQPMLERLRALEEDQIARGNELKEAIERQLELERNISNLQKLLELKNEQLAELQRQLGTSPAAQLGDTVPAEPLPETAAPAESAPASVPAPVSGPAEAPVAGSVPAMVEPATPPAELPAVPKPPVRRRPSAPLPEPVPPPPGFLEELLGNPLTLAVGGGVLALLLGYAGYRVRQQRKENAPNNDPEPLPAMSGVPNSVFGEAGGQSVDTSSSSVLQTDFSHSGLSSIDTDEGVDPVAEADVYMAYGRDAQAEEILVDALKADSTRLAIYLKLLEVYASRKSPQQFETTAAELYARTEGNGPEWAKAAAMGCEIDPGNPLYAGGDRKPAKNPDIGVSLNQASVADPAMAVASQGLPVTGEQPAPASGDSLDTPNFELPNPLPRAPEPELVLASSPAEPAGQILPPPAAAAALGAGVSAVGINAGVLDFDLDLGLDELPAEEDANSPEAGEFSLDFDLPAVPSAEKPAEPAIVTPAVPFDPASTMADTSDVFIDGQTAERELDLESAEATLFDLADTVIQSSGTFDSDNAEEDVDLGKNRFDNNLLDFDLEIDALPQVQESGPPAADLSDIDLNLDPSAAGGAPAEAAPASKAAEPAAPDDLPDQETDTKLELARAYEEMGDKEGARELLEEVLREGSPAQQGVARDLLARFG